MRMVIPTMKDGRREEIIARFPSFSENQEGEFLVVK